MSGFNSVVFLTENDLNSIGFNFLAKPTLEFPGDECGNCETARSGDGDGQLDKKQEEKEREEEKCKVKLTPATELKTPPKGEFKKVEDDGDDDDDDDDDGFKTPTSLDHKISLFLPCPPAPRKLKPLPSTKRRAPGPIRRVLLDRSNEIQSLFPPHLGGKCKRLRLA